MFKYSAILFFGLSLCIAASGGEVSIDFARDVRPILSTRCLQCHGPDETVRKAGLRLDRRESAIASLKNGKRAIVPGKPGHSELLARITATDERVRMPKGGPALTKAEVATLTRWIEQGAEFSQHWAYVKPVRHALPGVADRAWSNGPIDRFILSRLEKEGLTPNGPTDRHSLIRRLSIDLTGLPPTVEDADAFAADSKPDAYEKLVDRLLTSPKYGERWASVWLDLARYADSQGYANDPDRTIWRWRDWVIQALNHNQPYDQFTIEQLAGDMLPKATQDQLIATGFHRNTLTNTEGGTSPEEFRSAAIVDRVNTTMQVWMGTTINCCQCHNHKYDPFSQKEFYQLYAILNNCEDANGGNDAPTIQTPRIGYETEQKELEQRLAAANARLDELNKKLDAKIGEWEKSAAKDKLPKEIADILAKTPDKRDAKQKERLLAHHRSISGEWKKMDDVRKALKNRIDGLMTTTPILREAKPRETHIHIRGNFLAKGDKVSVGLPAALHQPPNSDPINRLSFAKWLMSAENPLAARVAVNRLWEEVFGIGLVETSEEFGMQGELPSHPELLDWLATEYVRIGWDTKRLLKLLVMSAAYQQSSRVSETALQKDPVNRLLSRGPRVRLSAEAVRDQALFVSGLMSPKMYGPPVQPPKPNFGLSAAFGSSTDWQPSTGEDKHRRALYTRIRRNAPYPSMTTFDAPERTYCNIRRIRTNTPLQALVTLNDPVYIEAAQALSRRIVSHGGSTAQERAVFAFRQVLTRPPTELELKRLVQLFAEIYGKFASDLTKAAAVAEKPLGPLPPRSNAAEYAAWTVVGNVLFNLDETLAKR